jgi:hypothetical protein
MVSGEKQKASAELKWIRISKDEEINRMKSIIREKDQLLLAAKEELDRKDLYNCLTG